MLSDTYTYTREDVIKLRKIRDTLGLMMTDPKFEDKYCIVFKTVDELWELPGVIDASTSDERGVVNKDSYKISPDGGWEGFR